MQLPREVFSMIHTPFAVVTRLVPPLVGYVSHGAAHLNSM